MAGVFLAVCALGLVVALALKPAYQAHSSLLVRLSPEYVYNPRGRATPPEARPRRTTKSSNRKRKSFPAPG